MRKLAMASLLLCFALMGMAQGKTVTGKVTDKKDGTALAGVSVTVSGGKGTNTEADGSYSITVASNAKTLTFSFVGFESVSLPIPAGGVLNVELAASDNKLDEVVVVGYGVQQKKAFTGSAAKVDADKFKNLVTPSIDKQLAGRATGVQVTTVGGQINAPARISIRGTNSINQANDPLIVVDGVPIISGNLAAATNSNALADINPSDIENIEVLKDGSATAIFGSRAAAGVIMITTKRGSKGRARVSYEGFIGFSSALKRFDLLNASEFVTIANEKLTNASQPVRANLDPNGVNTNWQDYALIDNAPVQSHTVSVQGGSDKTMYYFSMNYSDQQGVVVSNSVKNYRLRLNLEHEVNKWVKLGNNATLSRQLNTDQNNGSNALSGSIASALRLLPNVSPFSTTHFSGYNINWPTGNSMSPGPNTTSVDDNFTNVAFTLNNNKYNSDLLRVLNNTFVEVSPLKGLKFRSQFGVDFLNDYSYQGWSNLHGDGYGTSSGGTNGLAYNANQNFLRWVWQNYINYNLSIGNAHNFFLTAGYEAQEQTTKWLSVSGTNISDMFFVRENFISGSAAIQSIGGNYSKSGFESVFGRLNYDYKGKYFLQGSIRRDGQSSLAPDKRYGVFPGASVGWRVSQEGFWKNNQWLAKNINEVKFKASYARVGNTLGGFPFLSTYGARPYGNISGIAVASIGNSDLQWETSNKFDVGVELGLMNNRFNVTADWFLNDVDNLVLGVPTPLSAGIPGNSISQNIGTLQNKGIELSIGGDLIRGKNFNWNFNLNYSDVRNKITSLYSIGGNPVPFIQNGGYNLIQVGESINVIHGVKFVGVNSGNGHPVYQKADGTLAQLNLTPQAGASVGAYYVANSLSDPKLGAQTSLTFADRQILGVATPTWFGAFTNNFSYKGLSLEVMLRYSGGNEIMNITKQDALMNQSFQNNGKEILNRWTTAGQVTDVPKLYYGGGNAINLSQQANSRFVESGDYLRLQNVVLSYQLPTETLTKLTNDVVRSLRIYAQGQNLAVWTKYSGADPDNISSQGLDNAVSPQIRTFSFGVNVGF